MFFFQTKLYFPHLNGEKSKCDIGKIQGPKVIYYIGHFRFWINWKIKKIYAHQTAISIKVEVFSRFESFCLSTLECIWRVFFFKKKQTMTNQCLEQLRPLQHVRIEREHLLEVNVCHPHLHLHLRMQMLWISKGS